MARLPRSVKIIVHDGRNLDYRVVGSKKTPQTRRWRVIFIGGEKKQATGIIDDQDGFPRWDCEVSIVTPKPVDSVRMLVVDGKEREVGQVVISLTDLPWPPTPPPPLVTSQLYVRELQPTKRNPTPCGQISFWLWTLDYWPEGTLPANASSLSHSKHNSLRGSISHLGAALKSQPHGSSVAASAATGTGDSHSRIGNKLRDIKNRVNNRGGGGANSYMSSGQHTSRSSYERQQQQQPEEASVVMGASIISAQQGLGGIGWTSGASEMTGVTGGGMGGTGSDLLPNIANGNRMDVSSASYNPLPSREAEEEEEEANAGRSYDQGGAKPSAATAASSTPALNGGLGGAWKSTSSHGEGKSRRRAVVDHLRNKLSRSSANLDEVGHRNRHRLSSVDGSRSERQSKVLLDDAKVPLDPPVLQPATSERRSLVQRTDAPSVPNPLCTPRMVKEEWGLPATQASAPAAKSSSSANPLAGGTAYGLHPEEGPGKSKEDMTKRELIELANLLEERLINTRTELVRVNMEQNQLNAQVESLNSELSQTRSQLLGLQNRLLEDNLTEYLEVNGGSPARTSRSERLTTFQPRAPGNSATALNSPTGSFLSRAKAFASKSFGSIAHASTPQLASTNHMMASPHRSPSPPQLSNWRPGGVDYGSVW